MPITKVFKAGNSQAVRIPAEIAYDASITEVEVERHGDTLVVRPRRQSMADLIAALDALPSPRTIRSRPEIDWPERGRLPPDADAKD